MGVVLSNNNIRLILKICHFFYSVFVGSLSIKREIESLQPDICLLSTVSNKMTAVS